jgi:hypothetical protein
MNPTLEEDEKNQIENLKEITPESETIKLEELETKREKVTRFINVFLLGNFDF